jgi:hypothetical protein
MPVLSRESQRYTGGRWDGRDAKQSCKVNIVQPLNKSNKRLPPWRRTLAPPPPSLSLFSVQSRAGFPYYTDSQTSRPALSSSCKQLSWLGWTLNPSPLAGRPGTTTVPTAIVISAAPMASRWFVPLRGCFIRCLVLRRCVARTLMRVTLVLFSTAEEIVSRARGVAGSGLM